VITNNVSDSATFSPWLQNAVKHGISASIVLPIRFNDRINGAINIYSEEINAFDTHETNILQRLADNVSIAIQNIRIRKEIENTKLQLKERVKELTTIYNINRILQNEHLSTEVVFSDIVEMLPAGWLYPENCAAKINFDDQVFHTANYTSGVAFLSRNFNLLDGRSGNISVTYLKECAPEYEGPFLKEEVDLLESIAETITVYFNKAAQQRSLITSEANFRGSFEYAAIGMSLVYTDGRYFKVNKALCKMLGYTAEEFYSLNFRDITNPEDVKNENILIEQLLKGESDYFRTEKRYFHKNGSLVWGNLNVSIVRDTNGSPTHLVSQVENITSKKLSEEALMNSEANLRAIFDTTEVSYILVDTDFRIKMFNQYFYKEYAAQTNIELEAGKNILNLLLPEKQSTAEKIFRKVLVTSQSEEYETIYDNIQPTRYFNVLVSPVISNGVVIGLCIASQDITGRKNLELEKQFIIQDLIQRNRDLEEFGHIVSHNIRGPLSTLLGIKNLLMEEPPESEEQRYLLAGINTTSEKLDMVIRDLNEILQVRRGSLEPKTNVSLNEVLADIQSGLKDMIAESKAEIRFDFNKLNNIFTVRSYMNTVFYNLITNSIRFARPGVPPVLKIWSEKEENNMTLYFQDNGIGIDLKRHRHKMFMLYQCFHPATEGKGIGLFMTKTQIESLNGKIEVESQPDAGSTFKISLPLN
jgi:PAS domain S-box-containing protein